MNLLWGCFFPKQAIGNKIFLLIPALLISWFNPVEAKGPDSIMLRFYPDTFVSIIPGPQYKKNIFFQLFIGTHHRPTWTVPVHVPVLDMHASGLEAYRKGGSRETLNLRMRDPQGREYVARSVDKDLSKALPESLRKSILGSIMRDQVSANYPYAPLIVAPLAHATGVYYCEPKLCVLPSDEKLGAFRQEFSGMLVTIEPRPHKSWASDTIFGNSSIVLDTEELFEYTSLDSTPVDAAWFLKTRLLDMLVGDWSRHEDQYRWILLTVDGKQIFRPVPRDRDHAFYKFNDGIFNRIILLFKPNYQSFSRKIRNVSGLNRSGWVLDKRFLPSLSYEEWMNITRKFQSDLSDAEIEKAVRVIPPELQRKDADAFVSKLISRRDNLHKVSEKYYRIIHATP